MFSDELIVGIATCVTTIIATAFTIRTNKLHPIDEERYKKVLFPIMCILQAEDFRFNSIEKSTTAILKIKTILKSNRYLAGEIISQYIFEFENASCLKHQRRAFCFLCEYILKQFNHSAKLLGLPKISYRMREKRFWVNRYSVSFLLRFVFSYILKACFVFFFFITLLFAIYYILSILLHIPLPPQQ